jgi:TonB family protein
MTLEWVAYALVVGLLTSVAALAAEQIARLSGRATRWAWLGGMIAALGIPLVPWRLPSLGAAKVETGLEVGSATMIGLAAGELASPGPDWLDGVIASSSTWVAPAWMAASAAMMFMLMLSWATIWRRRRGWRPRTLGGESVLLSHGVGPAVVGVLRPRIVLPMQVLDLDEDRLRLVLAHEREHLRAHDPLLLFGALMILVAMPWNPGLWWQFHRLRQAVELDCDARVVRRYEAVKQYGQLLLEVVSWAPAPVPLGAGFAESASFLKRRLRMLTSSPPRFRALKIAVLAALATTAVTAAYATPRPAAPTEPLESRLEAVLATVQPPAVEPVDTPTFTPFEVAPRLQNRAEVGRVLQASYPQALRDAGMSGTTEVWLFVDETGVVRRSRMNRSSGLPALDAAAEQVVMQMRFSPALNRGEPVAVWISIPLSFRVDAAAAEQRERAPQEVTSAAEAPPVISQDRAMPEQPVATPFEVEPRLLNRAEVGRALPSSYPTALRDAGMSGTVQVWILIDETGAVRRSRVNQSSGLPALDAAAEQVVMQMRFSPALNRGEPVAVWISIPLSFMVQ